MRKSFLYALVRLGAFVFMLLPFRFSLWVGRFAGSLGYYLIPAKRKIVYANLKTVFSGELPPSKIRSLTKNVFVSFAQSFIELLCLPKLISLGLDQYVTLEGRTNIDHGYEKGKGFIFLAMHSGSWELASIFGGPIRGPYHIVANDQSKLPQLDKMLNEYRIMAGARIITAGVATKEIIKAMHRNEAVSLVLDQGGKNGIVIPFLGKAVSMSTGAIRLALKYGCTVCPVWIQREADGRQTFKVFPALEIVKTGDPQKDVRTNIINAAKIFEDLIRNHPQEYLWFYKVFKYSNRLNVLILDDGRTGHLRQSQAIASNVSDLLRKKGKFSNDSTVELQWRSTGASTVFPFYAYIAQYLRFLRREDVLRFFLTPECYKELMKYKADYIISCGSIAAGVNFILSRSHMAKSVSILTPGLLSQSRFNVMIIPEHDKPRIVKRSHLIMPKASPNLINAAYLKEQRDGLIKHYSHLKGNVRTKFGVLLGGDTKGVKFDEAVVYELLRQIKDAALHYNADILLTTSRRTSEGVEGVVLRELKNFERCSLCIIANQRNVPEAVGGILGLSDLIIVSGESISMVSEALSSGKRTIVFSPHGDYRDAPRDKYEDFVLKLHDQRYLMVSSVYDLKSNIAQLLNRKITLKTLDDQSIIQSGLEAAI